MAGSRAALQVRGARGGSGVFGDWDLWKHEHPDPTSCGIGVQGVPREEPARTWGCRGRGAPHGLGCPGKRGAPQAWGSAGTGSPKKRGAGGPCAQGMGWVPKGPIAPSAVPCLRCHSHTRDTPKSFPAPSQSCLQICHGVWSCSCSWFFFFSLSFCQKRVNLGYGSRELSQ